ncbi:MAG: zinc ABC transporter solute-binding protein [Chloroflexi bacterium]|jgi:zinc transport system substrate-binding protein|nr:zinc ABC transporter solute-binding protein [Chloroflexota bacterium]
MNFSRSALLVILLVAISTVAIACDGDLEPPPGGEITVITTTYPLTFLSEKIGGNRITIKQLAKPGVEAHDFEPAPSDIRDISNSDLFIYNHPAFESWALNAAASAASADGDNSPTVTVQTINLEAAGENHGGQEEDHSTFDAHVWLNPLKAQEQADRILSALIEVDPEGAQIYTRNADGLDVELQALDDLIGKQISSCELDSVVVSHLAFGHMAERYGFGQIGLAGLSPEFESGPAQIAGVIKKMNDLGISHIMQEPNVSDRLAETVAAETGAELLTLHPLEVRTSEQASSGVDYLEIMKSNADALQTALRCD